jgi:uncharacterized protein DUF3883
MAIPQGITSADILEAIHDFDAGTPHPYGDSTRYDLVFEDRRYPPKAIVGFAARRLNGGTFLDPVRDFSGGESTSAANRVLRDLGFVVTAKISDSVAGGPSSAYGRPWTPIENGRLATAYFEMLADELAGRAVVKRAVTRRLEVELPGRTHKSIEFKLQNVSAVLFQEGFPWIEGYKPAVNFQRVLRDAVLGTLDGPRNLRSILEVNANEVPANPVTEDLLNREIPAPAVVKSERTGIGQPRLSVWPGAFRDEANRALGRKGEEWIVTAERERLARAGHKALSKKVEWVSQTRGDGLGFDILSFSDDGAERWIEVKTTNAGPTVPFLLTRHELDVWESNVDRYSLRRLVSFSRDPHFYRVEGDPRRRLNLNTAVWEGTPT